MRRRIVTRASKDKQGGCAKRRFQTNWHPERSAVEPTGTGRGRRNARILFSRVFGEVRGPSTPLRSAQDDSVWREVCATSESSPPADARHFLRGARPGLPP